MTVFRGNLTILMIILGSASCSYFGHCPLPKEVTAETWLQKKGKPICFPELTDQKIRPAKLKNFNDSSFRYGVSFSGGGTRSASATLGQIRALESLKWIEKLHYTSSISGGCWTAIPYSFIPDQASDGIIGNKEFLGTYLPPSQMTYDSIRAREGLSAQTVNIADSNLPIIPSWLTLQGDEGFSTALNKVFLKKLGLGKSRFFSYDGSTRGLVSGPSQLTGKNAEIYASNQRKPYPIASGTLDDRNHSTDETSRSIYHLEMTPHYVGSPAFWTSMDKNGGKLFGGQYMASLAYDSKWQTLHPDKSVTVSWQRRGSRFTLSDILAVSGAAPSEAAYRTLWLSNIGLPEMKHGHPRSYSEGKVQTVDGLPHGDGGNLDGLAVRPLLARGVNRILAFVNSPSRFGGVHYLDADQVASLRSLNADEIRKGLPDIRKGNEKAKKLLDTDLIGMFVPLEDPKKINANRKKQQAPRPVFKNGYKKLEQLYASFVKCKQAGKPLVHCDDYTLLKNDRFGIPGGGKVKITWVYLDGSSNWLAKMPDGRLKNRLTTHHRVSKLVPRRLRRFPNYKTFGEQRGLFATYDLALANLVDLSLEQTNTLTQYADWVVRESSDKISNHLDLD